MNNIVADMLPNSSALTSVPEASAVRARTLKASIGCTGIGLHMSRQIIQDSMGGRITARNLDPGAELEVLVPLADC